MSVSDRRRKPHALLSLSAIAFIRLGNSNFPSMTTVPLGDQAVLAYLPDEAAAVRLAQVIRAAALSWLEDVVPAYASVGVFFDADRIGAAEVAAKLQELHACTTSFHSPTATPTQRTFRVPVCYEMESDMARVRTQTGLSTDEVIRLHISTEFTVYAIGFVPGFPYMGYLPEVLCGVGRLASPRLRVEPGSVGMTGRQTGIYPLPRPGGWNLIGRTPLVIVDVAAGFFPLCVGDRVRFERIDERQFREQEGERLLEESVHRGLTPSY
jgi:inhibitor of KinA